MLRLMLRRLIEAVPTLLLITIVSFALIHLAPGGPAEVMAGNRASAALLAQINRSLGLDKPLYVQYWVWLTQLLHGNLGYAYTYHDTVVHLIEQNLPRTLLLVVSAIVISHVVAIITGIYQAIHRNTLVDHALTAITYFLYSMPSFWLGVIILSIFSYKLGWFPAGGIANPVNPNPGLGSLLRHLALPALVLILLTVAGWSRYVRSAVSETLVQDYMRTARAKGVAGSRLLIRHALKNALLPLITLMGLSLPFLFSGALIIEVIFDYPGMGLLFWNAAQARDYPILLGIVLIVGVLTILGNLLADILYGWADPRIKFE